MKNLIRFLSIVFIFIFVAACTKPVAKCTAPEDNPQHHYLRGMENLEQGKVGIANEKLERALFCDTKFSPAYSGLSIVIAEKARAHTDPKFRGIEVDRVKEQLKKAAKIAESDEDKFDYFVAVIRVNTLLKEKEWLKTAEDAFNEARKLKVDEKKLIYYQGVEAANYFLGIAYLDAKEFQNSRDKFADVLNLKRDGRWHEKADKLWKRVDKIVRAMAGITVGDVGKQIAVQDSVTRADLAALLIDELKIDKLFEGRIPVKSKIEKMTAEFTPHDILNNAFKDEILTIMKWRVRGLEPKYDEITKAYLFKPADLVSRGEMAFILEDVLMKLTGDEKIATAYFGQEKSPFPDVKTTSPFYNAVMNMTTRGVMDGELSGEFRINEPIDGAEALLAIRVLRQRINVY